MMLWFVCWTANREVRGSNPGQKFGLRFLLCNNGYIDLTLSAVR